MNTSATMPLARAADSMESVFRSVTDDLSDARDTVASSLDHTMKMGRKSARKTARKVRRNTPDVDTRRFAIVLGGIALAGVAAVLVQRLRRRAADEPTVPSAAAHSAREPVARF